MDDDKRQLKVIVDNLTLIMEKYDLTQRELGDIAGVSESAVSKWLALNNAPSMGSVQRIADRFGLKKSDIFEEPNEYYLDPEARELAQLMSERKDLRMLLSAARDISPEDVEMVNNLIESLRRKEKGY